jgi:hypothetical protein
MSVGVAKYPAVVLLAQPKMNEDEIVFYNCLGVVDIHLFADDTMASGLAPHLIDVVNGLAGSYSLSHSRIASQVCHYNTHL